MRALTRRLYSSSGSRTGRSMSPPRNRKRGTELDSAKKRGADSGSDGDGISTTTTTITTASTTTGGGRESGPDELEVEDDVLARALASHELESSKRPSEAPVVLTSNSLNSSSSSSKPTLSKSNSRDAWQSRSAARATASHVLNSVGSTGGHSTEVEEFHRPRHDYDDRKIPSNNDGSSHSGGRRRDHFHSRRRKHGKGENSDSDNERGRGGNGGNGEGNGKDTKNDTNVKNSESNSKNNTKNNSHSTTAKNTSEQSTDLVDEEFHQYHENHVRHSRRERHRDIHGSDQDDNENDSHLHSHNRNHNNSDTSDDEDEDDARWNAEKREGISDIPSAADSYWPSRDYETDHATTEKPPSRGWSPAFVDFVNREHKIIQYNVGGQRFATSRDTIANDEFCMLNVMLKHESSMASSRDTSGALFIDRDPTYFKYVLNYLRNGIVDLPPERYALNALLREAEFYQINVRSKLKKLKKLRSQCFDHNFHYNSCNYRCCDFFYLISLLMSFIESHLSNTPKQCIQKVQTMKFS